jgi:hypothetical protein
MEQLFHHGLNAAGAERRILYTPKVRPGFVAWTTCFEYGDGRIGLSFKETLRETDPNYIPPKLEMGEAVGAPVSYCSVECGSEQERSFRVYMASEDNGKTFTETGRCPLEEGSFCNMGFPDGRILGYDVPRINAARTGWFDGIKVRQSTDGGSTWRETGTLLEGSAPYLWRARRLRDGTLLLLLSLYGTPWGEGRERTTRNTMLPGETYINKIQTCFLASKDGVHFTGPHYVLPGIGAHEYDVCECPDGRLLFLAGDVQATPVGRQFVERSGEGYLNGTLYGMRRGAPADPKKDPMGGFVPESLVMRGDGLIIGSRRNKPYSCSADYGENWYEVDGLPASLYQPFLLAARDGTILNFGHKGGDMALGQEDMVIGVDRFRVESRMPHACALTLSREMDAGKTHYINAFSAVLSANGQPVSGQKVLFRAHPVWNADGSFSTISQSEASLQLEAVTDENGVARMAFPVFDNRPDIHFYYNIDVVFRPKQGAGFAPCDGPMMCVSGITPHRRERWPYDAYLAEGKVFLSPALQRDIPDAIRQINALGSRRPVQKGELSDALLNRLVKAHLLNETPEGYEWYPCVHPKDPFEALDMGSGDWYI